MSGEQGWRSLLCVPGERLLRTWGGISLSFRCVRWKRVPEWLLNHGRVVYRRPSGSRGGSIALCEGTDTQGTHPCRQQNSYTAEHRHRLGWRIEFLTTQVRHSVPQHLPYTMLRLRRAVVRDKGAGSGGFPKSEKQHPPTFR